MPFPFLLKPGQVLTLECQANDDKPGEVMYAVNIAREVPCEIEHVTHGTLQGHTEEYDLDEGWLSHEELKVVAAKWNASSGLQP